MFTCGFVCVFAFPCTPVQSCKCPISALVIAYLYCSLAFCICEVRRFAFIVIADTSSVCLLLRERPRGRSINRSSVSAPAPRPPRFPRPLPFLRSRTSLHYVPLVPASANTLAFVPEHSSTLAPASVRSPPAARIARHQRRHRSHSFPTPPVLQKKKRPSSFDVEYNKSTKKALARALFAHGRRRALRMIVSHPRTKNSKDTVHVE